MNHGGMLFIFELPRHYRVVPLSSFGHSLEVDHTQLGSSMISPVCTVGLLQHIKTL